MPLHEALVGDTRPLLLILLSAVALVLLMASANVANILLVRATSRQREMAIRAALGAGRGRLIRQLLTESVLLSLVGGALGLGLGFIGIRALLAVNTAGLPLVGDGGSTVDIDHRVLGFALATSLLTGILFGLIPAIQGSRANLSAILKDTGGGAASRWWRQKTRAALVVSETSVAVVLLVGSALLIRSFVALSQMDRGFASKNVITLRTSLMGPKYATSLGAAEAIHNGLEHLRSVPGVVAASATCCVPLDGDYGLEFEILGRPSVNSQDSPGGAWTVVSPGFFDVFKIPVIRGRTFTDRDDAKAPPVVIISEHLAQEYWKDQDPLGARILIGKGLMKEFDTEPPRQIIGVVGDVRYAGLNADPSVDRMMYVPQAQLPDAVNGFLVRSSLMAWVVRTQTDPRGQVPALREQLRQATGLPVSNVLSMDEVLSLSTGRQRFNMLVMTVFGCAALLLAAIGLYGLMAYTVAQRTSEIGIRLALGAEGRQVRAMVVRQGMTLALGGAVLGTGAAWGLSRVMESLLFGVKAHDPIVFFTMPTTLSAVALLAVWLPATRASRVNPADSLRHD